MFPASAFAAEMKSRGWRVGLMTDERGRIYTDGFPADWIINVKAATFASKRPDKLLGAGLKILSGVKDAQKKLKAEQASLVASSLARGSEMRTLAAKAIPNKWVKR